MRQAGAHVARQATAAGLSGLAVALFIGVMAFAISTNPADRDDEDAPSADQTAAHFLPSSTKAAEVRSLSTVRAGTLSTPDAIVAASDAAPANQRALLASRDDVDDAADRVDEVLGATPDVEPLSPQDTATPAVAGASATPLTGGEGTPDDEGVTVAASVLVVPAGTTPELAAGDRAEATVSFYYCQRGERGLHPGDGGKFCGVMRDGDVVYDGAAACDYAYLGQRFRILGDPLDRVYTCADTGSAVHGLHRDIWFMTSDEGWSWQLQVGQVATIEIVE